MGNSIQNMISELTKKSEKDFVNANDSTTSKQIADIMESLDKKTRATIYLAAFHGSTKQLADKIDQADEIVDKRKRQKLVYDFKEALANSDVRDFLSSLSLNDKTNLEEDMGILRLGLSSESQLIEEEQKYLDLIEDSIADYTRKAALKSGFESIDEWRKFNERNAKKRLI